jgi:hypothetical protein
LLVWLRPAAYGLVLAVVVAPGLVATPAAAATQVTLSPASSPPGTEFVVTGTGLAPSGRTNQSAGAVSNPALLFLGLALVFGGGVFLAVRNRYRA